jgi:limonene 1,2-monooxygenase
MCALCRWWSVQPLFVCSHPSTLSSTPASSPARALPGIVGRVGDQLRFGIFLAPFHSIHHNAPLAIERDLELIERLDQLGYEEAWFGEHHSGGYESVPSPEVMVAAAAQRTKRIKLCTGVISLPYHHPLIVADRIVFLDNLTRGRFIAGFGPGALPADSYMMGLDYATLRPRMEQSLQAILDLLTGTEPIDRVCDWFTLRQARVHLASYSTPHVPLAVASAISPSGPTLAGKHGLGLISFAAASEAGFQTLSSTWSIVEEQAAEHGKHVDRTNWALVGMMHVAETEAQARQETRYGLRDYYEYLHTSSYEPLWDLNREISHDEMVDRINASGTGLIGTPAMAVEHLTRYQRQTGGFGAFLFFATEWGDREAVLRSFELFAREVVPHFDGSGRARMESFAWKKAHRSMLREQFAAGVGAAQKKYAEERAARSPAGEDDGTDPVDPGAPDQAHQ